MVQQVTTTSPLYSTPYLTVSEFKQAPTSTDVDDLVGGGVSALQDVELGNVLARASSWADVHCGQVLAATVDTENRRARVSRDGTLRLHPRYWPCLAVTAFSYGTSPNALTAAADLSNVWIEPMAVVAALNSTTAFLGSMQFSSAPRGGDVYCRLTYVNGYANTTLTTTTTANATALPVADATGIVAGSRITVYDGVNTETVTVSSSWTHTTGAVSVTLASGMAYAHTYTAGPSSAISVSAMPPAIKQAAIYLTSAILKARGNASLVMGSITPNDVQNANPSAAGDLQSAWDLLAPFRRMR